MPNIIPWRFLKIFSVFLGGIFVFQLFLPVYSFGSDHNGLAYYYFLLALRQENPEKAEKYLKKAIKLDKKNLYLQRQLVLFYIQNKKLKEAETLAEKLLLQHPNDKEINLFLAKIYLLGNRPYKAANLLENLLEKDPKNEEVLSLLISIYLEKKDWNAALSNLDKLLKIDSNNYIAWLFKARVLKELKRNKEAKEAYLNALKTSSDNKVILMEVLKFLEETNDFQQAEEILKILIQKYPVDENFFKLLIGFYLEKEAWEKSEKILKEVPESLKDKPEILFFLGLSLEKQKKLDEALDVYQKILPENEWGLEASKRIVLILRKKDRKAALNYLKTLEEKAKKDKSWYVLLISSAEALDLCEKGIQYGEEAIKLFRDEVDLILSLASNYACLENYQKVLDLTLPLLKKFPENPHILNFIGYSYVELGKNLEEAEEILQKALQLKPNDPYILDSLGWCYSKMGKIDLALEYLEKAVQNLFEEEAVILEHLADILVIKKETSKACEFYQKALKASFHLRDTERIKNKLQTLGCEKNNSNN
ncbi:tetratricopeptide repeat protein [Thermodesulfobacterium sp. TA1]|uniref:tetratricopeptide repeat protein n=1 Tax=Thermodesulfobacterium sp. TA1 TaxID=2234087 RepID=UPI001232BE5C|nr:tetratricopeptide repeat protein [Thermodesulfobacterium sp. TA1]QER42021.1 tetratricopeptide repeat protein [Thermodesulfobacterium sp. TA1]